MWACENIDESHLCNMAFSEDFSFCVSNPKSKRYNEDLWHEHRDYLISRLIREKCDSGFKQKEPLRRSSFPVASETINQQCDEFNEKDEFGWWREYWRSITNAPKIKDVSSIIPMRKISASVFEDENRHREKISRSLNSQTDSIHKSKIRGSSGSKEIQITLWKRDGTFGFSVAVFIGGFFIKTLTRKDVASKRIIRPGDRILQLNGRDISSFSHSKVISYLRNLPESVNLKICRSCTVWRFCSKHSPPEVQTFNVVLEKPPNGELNFSIRDSDEAPDIQKYLLPTTAEVENVFPQSLAHCVGIRAGDRMLEVNGESLLGKTAEEVVDILQKINGVVKLVFCRL